MKSTREYLKELINRGNALLNPNFDSTTITSAWQLANMRPSQEEINAWKRDVNTFSYRYLKDHSLYPLIYNDLNVNSTFTLNTLVVYLEKIFNDWEFWDSKEQKTTSVQQKQLEDIARYDVFVCHASADKLSYVDELKQSLEKLKIKIFYDRDTIEWGDEWKSKILEGVSKSEFAVIVISENFFGREWAEKELNELLKSQNSTGQKVILPILHKITRAQLQERYPAIADIQFRDSSEYTCDEIALNLAALLIKRLRNKA